MPLKSKVLADASINLSHSLDKEDLGMAPDPFNHRVGYSMPAVVLGGPSALNQCVSEGKFGYPATRG